VLARARFLPLAPLRIVVTSFAKPLLAKPSIGPRAPEPSSYSKTPALPHVASDTGTRHPTPGTFLLSFRDRNALHWRGAVAEHFFDLCPVFFFHDAALDFEGERKLS